MVHTACCGPSSNPKGSARGAAMPLSESVKSADYSTLLFTYQVVNNGLYILLAGVGKRADTKACF